MQDSTHQTVDEKTSDKIVFSPSGKKYTLEDNTEFEKRIELFSVHFSDIVKTGSIILCQEICLKPYIGKQLYKENAQRIVDEFSKFNVNMKLIADGATSAILYDSSYWKHSREIKISRNNERKNDHGEPPKFSNAHILQRLGTNNEICVVNVHLKAFSGSLISQGRANDIHIAELTNILETLWTNKILGLYPIVLGGDFNNSTDKGELVINALQKLHSTNKEAPDKEKG